MPDTTTTSASPTRREFIGGADTEAFDACLPRQEALLQLVGDIGGTCVQVILGGTWKTLD